MAIFRLGTGSAWALLAALALAPACETPAAPDDGVSAIQFADIPIPDGLKLHEHNHVSDAVVVGSFRHANFTYSGTIPVAEVSAYLRDRMPHHRWHLIDEETDTSGGENLRFRRGKYVAECRLAKVESITEMNVSVRTTYERMNENGK